MATNYNLTELIFLAQIVKPWQIILAKLLANHKLCTLQTCLNVANAQLQSMKLLLYVTSFSAYKYRLPTLLGEVLSTFIGSGYCPIHGLFLCSNSDKLNLFKVFSFNRLTWDMESEADLQESQVIKGMDQPGSLVPIDLTEQLRSWTSFLFNVSSTNLCIKLSKFILAFFC